MNNNWLLVLALRHSHVFANPRFNRSFPSFVQLPCRPHSNSDRVDAPTSLATTIYPSVANRPSPMLKVWISWAFEHAELYSLRG
ncbi:unnamed protein product [Protopolystoma xenopodis]|uniref:Uncharacterized protein n=1 Tax=Protopolystoma xenopodis TaxID=117903 RepID=A0A3S5B989_9PLAT|nr:unnamed protein product [Protopolystoma xenopodis]